MNQSWRGMEDMRGRRYDATERGANQSWPGMENMRGWRYDATEQTLSIHAQGQEEEYPEAAAIARLCLDLRGQLAGGLNYQHLLPCDGSGTQHWSLDRKSGQLESNNDTTQCLQGAEWWTWLGRPLVTLGTCQPINGTTGLAPPAQHWSSSPGGGMTNEAFGCVGVSFDSGPPSTIWSKPLRGGRTALLATNAADLEQKVVLDFASLLGEGEEPLYTVHDVWPRQGRGKDGTGAPVRAVSIAIAPHNCAMYALTKANTGPGYAMFDNFSVAKPHIYINRDDSMRLKTGDVMDAVLLGAKPAGEDSSMVVAPTLLLVKIAKTVLASRFVSWFCMAICMATAVRGTSGTYTGVDASALDILANVIWSFCIVPLAWVLFSLHRVTLDEGQLKKLGVGSTMISAKAVKQLKRWHVLTTAVPLILALQPAELAIGTEHSSLTAPQVQLIKTAVSLNGTCNFDNVTIGSVLRLKTDDELPADQNCTDIEVRGGFGNRLQTRFPATTCPAVAKLGLCNIKTYQDGAGVVPFKALCLHTCNNCQDAKNGGAGANKGSQQRKTAAWEKENHLISETEPLLASDAVALKAVLALATKCKPWIEATKVTATNFKRLPKEIIPASALWRDKAGKKPGLFGLYFLFPQRGGRMPVCTSSPAICNPGKHKVTWAMTVPELNFTSSHTGWPGNWPLVCEQSSGISLLLSGQALYKFLRQGGTPSASTRTTAASSK